MKVTTVSASVRYSKALGDGSHKTVELSAEATLTPQEEWHKEQATIYHQLGDQLKGLWTSKTNGQHANGTASVKGNGNGEHHCQEHGASFKRHDKDGQTWYSHKANGKWCNER
jgi:hypothetical protein